MHFEHLSKNTHNILHIIEKYSKSTFISYNKLKIRVKIWAKGSQKIPLYLFLKIIVRGRGVYVLARHFEGKYQEFNFVTWLLTRLGVDGRRGELIIQIFCFNQYILSSL